MKKNNWIVLAIALIASLLLAAIWFFNGFKDVHMLDLVLTVIWWFVIAASALLFKLTKEKDRKDNEQHEQHLEYRA